jgi:hypothetical protein
VCFFCPWSGCNLVLTNSQWQNKQKTQRNQHGEMNKQTRNKTNKQTNKQIPGSGTTEFQS